MKVLNVPVYQIWILLGLVACVYGEFCGSYHNEEKHIHVHKNGTSRCCVSRTCPQGTHGVLCYEDQPETTLCLACPDDSYIPQAQASHLKMECILKHVCRQSDGLFTIDNGSTTENRQCACDLSRGYYEESSIFSTHCVYKSCPAGQELTLESDCDFCSPGTYKQSEEHHRCLGWTDCHALGFEILDYGNRINDTTCLIPTEPPATPGLGRVTEEDRSPVMVVAIGVSCFLVFALPIALVIFFLVRRRSIKCNDSIASSSEKRALDRDASFSDSEETQDNKTNNERSEKNPSNLKITIPSNPVQESDSMVYPKLSTTPDSGIVSDLKQINNMPLYTSNTPFYTQSTQPLFTSSPVYGPPTTYGGPPTKSVECDGPPPSYENPRLEGGIPITMVPSFPQSEGSIDSIEKGQRPHIVVQTNGPVYLQYGNNNQMNSNTHPAADEGAESPEYVLEEEEEEEEAGDAGHAIHSMQETGDTPVFHAGNTPVFNAGTAV